MCGNISTMCHSTSLKICNLCYNLHILNFKWQSNNQHKHVNLFPFISLECSTKGLVIISNGLSEATNIISLKRK